MTTWFSSIREGMVLGSLYVGLLSIPYFVITSLIIKKINIVKYVINVLFILYISCVFAVVFLPLPTTENLPYEYTWQLIPGYAVYDCIVKPSLEGIAQVLFNVLLTMPFGAYLRYYWKMGKREIILMTLALSIFIEVGQLTGLFFVFNGSYRLCDVDDLILNTLGGTLGSVLVMKLSSILPKMNKYDIAVGRLAKKTA